MSKKYQKDFLESASTNKGYLTAKNDTQRRAIQAINNNLVTVLFGPPGTGKTLLSMWCLYKLLKLNKIEKIYVVRLCVETHGERLGAFPGDEHDKLKWAGCAVRDALEKFLPVQEIDSLMARGSRIEVIPLSHTRGRSLSNCGIIVEESQNLTLDQIYTLVTRLDTTQGEDARLIFTGDDLQVDIKARTGMNDLKLLLGNIQDCAFVEMQAVEAIRSPIICAVTERYRELLGLENPKENLPDNYQEIYKGFLAVPF